MEENKNNLPALRGTPPDKITKAQVLALFNTETVRLNYNVMLQGLQGMVITKDNLKAEYPEFKEADKFLKAMDTWRKSEAKPFAEVVDMFLNVYNEIKEPISLALNAAKAQVAEKRKENAAEIAQAKAEQARQDLIAKTLADFINRVTSEIMLSTTDAQIVMIQKRIGSEKNRKSFYAERYQELCDKCDALNETINNQKAKIREMQKLNEEFDKALKNNDDSAAAKIKEKLEDVNQELVENSIRLQEKAFEESLSIQQVEVGQPELNVTKGKTTRWKWRVDDIEYLKKKEPQFTKTVTNDARIEEFMKEQREVGAFKTDKEEFTVRGITFFKEIYY
jgi:tetratricopeptide (TPR) repeat protein